MVKANLSTSFNLGALTVGFKRCVAISVLHNLKFLSQNYYSHINYFFLQTAFIRISVECKNRKNKQLRRCYSKFQHKPWLLWLFGSFLLADLFLCKSLFLSLGPRRAKDERTSTSSKKAVTLKDFLMIRVWSKDLSQIYTCSNIGFG